MLEVVEVHKQYEGKPLLNGVSFVVEKNETICLLGASGSGKSTLLQIISGLQDPDSGKIFWNQKELSGMPVHKRNFGLMFQDYALFPHRSVKENVAFGLRMKSTPTAQIEKKVAEALQLVNMQGFENRRVTDLSGGEQQRIALARTLVPRPDLLMLDEPLGALDRTMRDQLLEQLRHILHTTGIPVIYVTHDQEEAYGIADRLILLHEGRIVQQGSPMEVYNRPANPWVARFLGLTNFLTGKLISLDPIQIQTPHGILESSTAICGNLQLGKEITVLLRPYGPGISTGQTEKNILGGTVQDVVFRSHGFQVEIQLDGSGLHQFVLDESPLPGERIFLHIPPEAVLCIAVNNP